MDDAPNVIQVSIRRKFNLGNYETLDIEFTATVNPETDDFREVAKRLDKETVKFYKSR